MGLRGKGVHAAGLALAALVACGDDDGDVIGPSPELQPAADAGEQPAPPPVEPVNCFAPAADMVVVIDQLTFFPAETSLQGGGVVLWRNEDSVDHTVTSGRVGQPGEGDELDYGVMGPGDVFCLEFSGTGSFEYHCEFHPTTMHNGVVTVSAGVTAL